MKAFIGACALFAAVLLGISFASVKLCKSTETLVKMAEAIPLSNTVDFETKRAALNELNTAFEEKLFSLSISVNRRSISHISEKLAIAMGYADAEDSEEFTAAVYALRDGLEALHEDVGLRLRRII